MPELPEVEVVRRGLEKQLLGAVIKSVEVFHPRSLRGQDCQFFSDFLQEWKITAVIRRGKFIWVLGKNEQVVSLIETDRHLQSKRGTTVADKQMGLLIHLGMSGQMLVKSSDRSEKLQVASVKHLRVRWELWHPGRKQQLVVDFVDQRTFGRMQLVELQLTTDGEAGGYGSNKPLIPVGMEKNLARDVLDPKLDWERIFKRVRGSRRAIKNILLDQAIVSGIGNIYADEALFAARIHPCRRGCGLNKNQVKNLYLEAGRVMRKALAEGGTSFDALYLNTDGNPGYFARSLQVYGRRGQACQRCEKTLLQLQIGGRSATFCQSCQPAPRSY